MCDTLVAWSIQKKNCVGIQSVYDACCIYALRTNKQRKEPADVANAQRPPQYTFTILKQTNEEKNSLKKLLYLLRIDFLFFSITFLIFSSSFFILNSLVFGEIFFYILFKGLYRHYRHMQRNGNAEKGKPNHYIYIYMYNCIVIAIRGRKTHA